MAHNYLILVVAIALTVRKIGICAQYPTTPNPNNFRQPGRTISVTGRPNTVTRTSTITRPGRAITYVITSTAPGNTVTSTVTSTVQRPGVRQPVRTISVTGRPNTVTRTLTITRPGGTITKVITSTRISTVTAPGNTVTSTVTSTVQRPGDNEFPIGNQIFVILDPYQAVTWAEANQACSDNRYILAKPDAGNLVNLTKYLQRIDNSGYYWLGDLCVGHKRCLSDYCVYLWAGDVSHPLGLYPCSDSMYPLCEVVIYDYEYETIN